MYTNKWFFSINAFLFYLLMVTIQSFRHYSKFTGSQILTHMVGTLTGYTLMTSSLFHLLFEEGRINEYDSTTWDYWIDTYEITVMVEIFVLMVTYHLLVQPKSRIMMLLSVFYLIYGMLWTWTDVIQDSDVVIAIFNIWGIIMGGIWFLQFTIIKTNKIKKTETLKK